MERIDDIRQAWTDIWEHGKKQLHHWEWSEEDGRPVRQKSTETSRAKVERVDGHWILREHDGASRKILCNEEVAERFCAEWDKWSSTHRPIPSWNDFLDDFMIRFDGATRPDLRIFRNVFKRPSGKSKSQLPGQEGSNRDSILQNPTQPREVSPRYSSLEQGKGINTTARWPTAMKLEATWIGMAGSTLAELFKDTNLVAAAEKVVAGKRIVSFTGAGISVAAGSTSSPTHERSC